MNKPISTKTHGMIDYAAGVAWTTLPALLGWQNVTLRRSVEAMGIGAGVYAACTDYELGVIPALTMKQHLVMDVVGGATLIALPYLTGERNPVVRLTCLLFGLTAVAAGLLTQTTPTSRRPVMRQRDKLTGRVSELVS
jgi:hypothetical protein